MMEIRLSHTFSKKQGGFSLRIALDSSSKRLAFFGPSGSGKTLTLHALAGLFKPQKGYIRLGGKVLFDSEKRVAIPARLRNLGYLFQDYALFPHLTVRQNIAFPFGWLWRRAGRREASERVNAMLDCFELNAVADHYPAGISGGQKQRTALARALVTRPSLLLLDEPFSALDPLLRIRIREQCLSMLSRFDIPTIVITHDPEDVIAFADSVSIYEKGNASAPVSLESLNGKQEGNGELLNILAETRQRGHV